jgi:NTE family protein
VKSGEQRLPIGLILPGGGARNAYQAGVLKAIAELLPEQSPTPFAVICGTSAGAINAAMLACYATQFQLGVRNLVGIWQNLHARKIYRTDIWTAIRYGWRWFSALLSGSLEQGKPNSLLNNTPLRGLLERHLRLARIQQAIDNGILRAVAINASGYTSGRSTCFFQGIPGLIPWQRHRRRGIATELTIDHLMASIAVPLIFPAITIQDEYYGDGSMREMAPLSPALHLGAQRLLVVTLDHQNTDTTIAAASLPLYPSFGQIAGYVLDTLFLDALHTDVENMNRINNLLIQCPQLYTSKTNPFRPIDLLILSPSRDLSECVPRHMPSFPGSVRFLLRALGATTLAGRPLVTYLLFESSFCTELIELGYQDTMQRKEEIMQFLATGLI